MPIDGPGGRALPRRRAAGRPALLHGHARARPARRTRIADDERVVAVFGGSLGAGRLNAAVAEAYGERGSGRAARAAGDGARQARGRAAARPAARVRVLRLDAASCCTPPTSSCAARAARCGRWRRPALPAILVPWSGAAGDHQAVNAALLRGAAPWSCPTPSWTVRVCGTRSRSCWPTSRAGPRWRRRCAGWRGPTRRRHRRRGAGAGREGGVTMHLRRHRRHRHERHRPRAARPRRGRLGLRPRRRTGARRAARARHRLRRAARSRATWTASPSWSSRARSTPTSRSSSGPASSACRSVTDPRRWPRSSPTIGAGWS